MRTPHSETITEALLWLLMAFLPWPFGSASPAAEAVVSFLVAGIALCLMWQMLFEKRPFIRTWAYVPLAALSGLAILSMIPLPVGLVAILSPESVRLRGDLLSHLPLSAGVSMTLSLYPFATAHMLRLLLGSAIVFVAVIHHCRTPRHILRLLTVIAIVGGILAAQTLLQDATSNGMIYWLLPAPVKSTSGPFVNYNNFSQFMNLCIGAGVALLLKALQARGFGPGHRAAGGIWEHLGDTGRRHVSLLIIMLLMTGLSVLLSTSRGGVLSMAAAGAVTIVLLFLLRDIGLPLKALFLVGLGLVLLLLSFGFESFMDRMETLSDLEGASGARWRVFKDVFAFAPNYAGVGIGLGTHEFVYPMFSHLSTGRSAQYVENEYIQLFEEMGVVGILLVAAFVAAIARNLLVAVRRGTSLSYVALGLTYGLVAVAVGSLTDFGQRIASISCLTAITCGLIVAIGRVDAPEPPISVPTKHVKALAISLPILGIIAWMLAGSTRAAVADNDWQKVVPAEAALVQKGWEGTDAQYAGIFSDAQSAAEWEPDNVVYRCWLNAYRTYAGSRAEVWNRKSPAEDKEFIDNLVIEFQKCELLCPTYGPSYAFSGQIRFANLSEDGGADEIRKAYLLAPTHPTVCFIAGRLSASQAKWDDAAAQFHAAVRLNFPSEQIMGVYVSQVHHPEKALEFFHDDWQSLGQLSRLLESGEPTIAGLDTAQLAQQARARSEEVLTAACQAKDASAQTLAAMADLLQTRGDWKGSIPLYRRAIDGYFANGDWHLALARALAQSGQTGEALREVDVCLHLRRPFPAAEKFRDELNQPASLP